jgi:hypothetical protein
MAESHPFANAGLGMFGQDVSLARAESTPERKVDKDGKPLNPIAMALGALIQQFGSKDQSPAEKAPIDFSAPPPQFEPKSIAPEVNQQQYVNPYQSGGGPNQIWGNQPAKNPVYGGVPMNPQTTPLGNPPPANNSFGSSVQNWAKSQTAGYHSLTEQMWGGR